MSKSLVQTTVKQLEPDLSQELKAALHQPEVANLTKLWQKLEHVLATINREDQQLLYAGNAIAQVVEIYVLRAKAILDSLEVTDDSSGPVLAEDFLSGLMRSSLTIGLSDLMEDLFTEDEVIDSLEPETQERICCSTCG